MMAAVQMRPTTLFTALVPLFLLACSGNAIVEPGAQTSKRAKLAIEKCEPPPVDGAELKEVYACFSVPDACPEPGDPFTKTELGYVLNKQSDDSCEEATVVYDVPCGPDLNAPVDCCYVVRVESSGGGCD